MKDLSTIEKAKRFDEILAKAKEYSTYMSDDVANYMFNMFPELKELKYKDGDWIVYDNNVYKIVNIPNGDSYECLGIDNTIRVYNSCIDNKSHLWTIEDAKAGDVLAVNMYHIKGTWIGIFKKQDGCVFSSYCYVNTEGTFKLDGRFHGTGKSIHPATKEERDILFQKMKEFGYEWDANKKEPIKL